MNSNFRYFVCTLALFTLPSFALAEIIITSTYREVHSQAIYGDQGGDYDQDPFGMVSETFVYTGLGAWSETTHSSLGGSSTGIQNTTVGVGGISGSGRGSASAPGISQGQSNFGEGWSRGAIMFTVTEQVDFDFWTDFDTYSAVGAPVALVINLKQASPVGQWTVFEYAMTGGWYGESESFAEAGQLAAGDYTFYFEAVASALMSGGSGGQQSEDGSAAYDFSFNLVPSPGAIAVFGLWGVVGSRRRR